MTKAAQNTQRCSNDDSLQVIADVSQVFLQGSLETWQDNVLLVLRELGNRLGISRIFMCKHEEVSATYVKTSLRYEWKREGDEVRIDVPGLQHIHLQEAGFSRWAGILFDRGIVHAGIGELPVKESGWFVSDAVERLIVVPVFVEEQWWGFIGFEDYQPQASLSEADLDAFMTIAVLFGAAIRRKHMEESLARERQSVEQKAREVVDVARFPAEDPSPVLRVSFSGVVTYANEAALTILGDQGVFVGGRVPEEWLDQIQKTTEDGKQNSLDVKISSQTWALSFVPVLEEHYVNVYSRNVTHEREVSQMKSLFISMASHQLRTPLTGVRWNAELLLQRRDEFDAKAVSMLEGIYKTSVQLNDLITDLLNIGRIERGSLEPRYDEQDVAVFMAEMQDNMRVQAEQKQITLDYAYEGVLMAKFDPQLVREIVTNLLSNAVKYTPENGHVWLRLRDEDQRFVVEVADDGYGIAEEDKAKLFERFFRSDKMVEKGIQGTGLGLSVVKLMVEEMGGELWVESAEGEGSTFGFWLPKRMG